MPSAVQIMPLWQAAAMRDTGIAFIVISGAAVALRFVAKYGARISLGADDWWILGAYALFLLEQLMQLYAIVVLINNDDVTSFLKYMYISAFFYYGVHTALRIGILCYFRRIFTTPSFRRMSMIVIVICILWFIPGTVVEIITCLPMEADWDPSVPGTCLRYMLFYVVIMSVELVLDAVIIAMPLREIYKLQMPLKRKIGVSLIFLVGAFVLITGTFRVVETYITSPVTLNLYSDVVFYDMNDGAAFLGACMPTYLPLLIRARELGSSLWSKVSSRGSNSRSHDTSTESKDNSRRWDTMPSASHGSYYHNVHGAKSSDRYATASWASAGD